MKNSVGLKRIIAMLSIAVLGNLWFGCVDQDGEEGSVITSSSAAVTVDTDTEDGLYVELHEVWTDQVTVRVRYSKNFDTCAHLYNGLHIVHQHNIFCTSGDDVVAEYPITEFNPYLVVGQPVYMIHGNDNRIHSDDVVVTGTPPVMDLHSVVINGDEVAVTYSKNFVTCAHLYNGTHIVHNYNLFCDTGTNVTITEPLSYFNEYLVVGAEVVIQHGNNAGIHSAPVTVTAAGLEFSLSVTSQWDAGYCADVSAHNAGTSTIATWNTEVSLNNSSVNNIWNGTYQALGNSNIRVTPDAGHATVAAGGTQTVGFCAVKTGANWKPTMGSSCIDNVQNGDETDTDCGGSCAQKCEEGDACVTDTDCETGTCTAGICEAGAALAQTTLTVQSDWSNGYCAQMVVSNIGTNPLTKWEIVLDRNSSTVNSIWGATQASTSGDISTLKSVDYNSRLSVGASATIGFCATKTGSTWRPSVVETRGSL